MAVSLVSSGRRAVVSSVSTTPYRRRAVVLVVSCGQHECVVVALCVSTSRSCHARREIVRPVALRLSWWREIVRPAGLKRRNFGVFGRVGRVFSRKSRWRGCVGRVFSRQPTLRPVSSVACSLYACSGGGVCTTRRRRTACHRRLECLCLQFPRLLVDYVLGTWALTRCIRARVLALT